MAEALKDCMIKEECMQSGKSIKTCLRLEEYSEECKVFNIYHILHQ